MMRRFIMLCCVLCAAPAYAMISVEDTSVKDVPVWYAQDASVPVVHIILMFEGAGTASDSEGKEGRAMLASRMLNEGAGDLPSLAFHKALESSAIKFSVSAYQDDVMVSLHCLKDELPVAARLLRLALTQPRFDAQALDYAKEEQRVDIRALRESPESIASIAWNKAMYGNHPYAKTGLGDVQSVNALSRDDLEQYRTRYLTRANLQIAAAGDASASELEDALEPLVEALPEAFFPERDIAGITLDAKGEVKRIAFNSPQSVVVFGGSGIGRNDKRFYAAYLMNQVLGSGGFTSRLMQNVRVKKGLVYGIGTALSDSAAVDSFVGQFSTSNKHVDAAIAEVKDTVRDMAINGISRTECRRVKDDIIRGFMLKLDSTQEIASIIAMMMRDDLGQDYIEKRAEYFEDVKCNDIQEAARMLLTPEQWMFVVVGGTADATQDMP